MDYMLSQQDVVISVQCHSLNACYSPGMIGHGFERHCYLSVMNEKQIQWIDIVQRNMCFMEIEKG